MSTFSAKTVQFFIEIGDDGEDELLDREHLTPLEVDLRQLYEQLKGIEEDQLNIKMRLKAHRSCMLFGCINASE